MAQLTPEEMKKLLDNVTKEDLKLLKFIKETKYYLKSN